jgi:hypothetical protein
MLLNQLPQLEPIEEFWHGVVTNCSNQLGNILLPISCLKLFTIWDNGILFHPPILKSACAEVMLAVLE